MATERLQFHEMGLDDRLLKAVADQGWSQPTLIQEKAIPLALEGKDLLARARTGSGKTAAYALPLIQRILASKQTVRVQDVRALVLVPTRELAQQAVSMLRLLTAFCSRDVHIADVSGTAELSAQRPVLMEKPDVVVGTPSRLLAHLRAQQLEVQASLEVLVVDEADLLFSFGFEEDLKSLLCHLPKIYQSFVMSATLSEDVLTLKELLLHNPVVLKLQGSGLPGGSQLQQFSVRCEEEEKFLLVVLKLQGSGLPGGSQLQQFSVRCEEEEKFLLVVLKLQGSGLPGGSQLQQFSVRCEEEEKFLLVVLKLQGSGLPGGSQLQQFSVRCEEEEKFLLLFTLLRLRLLQGRSLLFVSCVERCYRLKLFLEQFAIPACVLNAELPVQSRCHIITQFNHGFYDCIIATDEQVMAPATPTPPAGKGKKKKAAEKGGRTKDKEYGVSRGIDFQNVSNVINFDFPTTVEAYIHRVGRTARADNPGTALSFISHTELGLLSEVEEALTGDDAESVLKPYEFKMEEIEGFRYRCRDAMRSVTKQAVREARLKEIKQELLNSEKLKTYFEDNPRDLQLLRHDKDLHPAVVKPHLRNVPEYLMPQTLKSTVNPLLRKKRKRKNKSKAGGVARSSFKRNGGGKNPLKTFRYTGGRNRNRKDGAAKS